jgi:hypothetical protein
MGLDPVSARALRTSARRAWILAAVGVLLVVGFVAVALVDPSRFAPAVTADQSPWWVAAANIALTAGVVTLLVAVIGLARVRRQLRTVLRSAFRTMTARWAPTIKRAQHVPDIAIEQPDGSWLGLTLTARLRPRSFETRVRATGAVDGRRGLRLRGPARVRFDEVAVGQAEGNRGRARTFATVDAAHHAAGRRSHRDGRPRRRDLVP